MSALLLFPLVCQGLLALLLLWNRARTPALHDELRGDAPLVLALVPARDEEANIGACVEALLAQRYPALRVLVVDDHSRDRTAAVVGALAERDPRLTLLAAPDLPPGWLGKPHALHAGVQHALAAGADPAYLLFVDADLRLRPPALARMIAAAQHSGAGLLTMIPRLITESLWERAVQPVVATLLFGFLDPVAVNDPRRSAAAALGPCMLFSRACYDAVGGHHAVRGEVVEDLRLAQAVKRAQQRLLLVHGADLADLRMYDSLGAIVRGWRKNFFVVLQRALPLAPLCALLCAWAFAGVPLGALGLALYALGFASGKVALCAAGAAFADLLARLALRQGYRVTARGSRALGGVMVAWILCSSAFRAATGRAVTWRGRSLIPS